MEHAAYFREKDFTKLQEFSDICADITSQMSYIPALACLNYATLLRQVIGKLPSSLKEKWDKVVVEYAGKHQDAYPTFEHFSTFISKQAALRNHPNILIHNTTKPRVDSSEEYPDYSVYPNNTFYNSPRVLATNATVSRNPKRPYDAKKFCLLHDQNGHDISNCISFEYTQPRDQAEIVRKFSLCSRCLATDHQCSDCKKTIKCNKCGSNGHIRAFHFDATKAKTTSSTTRNDGQCTSTSGINVNTACTSVCEGKSGGFSCSKIVLVDILSSQSHLQPQRIYAIMDDQSNSSLIHPDLIDKLGLIGDEEKYYLTTCGSEKSVRFGRRIRGLTCQSLSGMEHVLPPLLECSSIPGDKTEVGTPDIASRFLHMRDIVNEIPPLDAAADVMLLIGRDAPELLKVRDSRNGPVSSPWAQRLLLGWTISGQVCLDRLQGSVHIKAHRTQTSGAPDYTYAVSPCSNEINITRDYSNRDTDIFQTTTNDDVTGLSPEDHDFLRKMDNGFHKNVTGNCEMPLPFRDDNVSMPYNRAYAERRLHSLQRSFARKPAMQNDYIDFMANMFENGHNEVITPTTPDDHRPGPGQVWYLPHFPVYNPKKPDKIRVVFDASAEYSGTSLNSVLLTGPDHMNSLFGVLVRFRKDNVALICDVEQMFHSFFVDNAHRDYLRFLWFHRHDPSREVVECRMRVHIFGNVSSPAVATYGMRRTATEGREEFGEAACEFVHNNFYVDDGLTSCATKEQATELIKNTQKLLKTSNMRLHKIASNNKDVMNSLPEEDRAKDVRQLDLDKDPLPSIRSLGVCWDLEQDVFTFKVSIPDKPFTRRGVLSVVNSIFDPLGFASPVTIRGKILLQKLNNSKSETQLDWDDPLPNDTLHEWQQYKDDLVNLENVRVPRCYHSAQFGTIVRAELHAFCDASQNAIGVAVYIRLVDNTDNVCVSLLYGQAKVSPTCKTTIPRLELCGAVMCAQAVQHILSEICFPIDQVFYYTDSQIVLGYIRNDSRRFYVYVSNRVQRIRNLSDASQWNHIVTTDNPADIASRGIKAASLMSSTWLRGPSFLLATELKASVCIPDSPLDHNDPNVRPETRKFATVTLATDVRQDDDTQLPSGENTAATMTHPNENVSTDTSDRCYLTVSRFDRFSSWNSVNRAIANILLRVKNYKRKSSSTVDPHATTEQRIHTTVEDLRQAEIVIIKSVQYSSYKRDIDNLKKGLPVSKESSLRKLDPFLDDSGVLRVGGRLRKADLEFNEKHPVIMPKNQHVTTLIIDHYHASVHHQGHTITHGAIRKAGFWIIGGQKQVSDRIEPSPPFTNVGFDVFGPWVIHTKKLRGGAAEMKRWGLVFTCLSSRAIHIELLESMDSSSFICALRRFFSLRGPVRILRSDCGTNFIGGKNELDDSLADMHKTQINKFVTGNGCEWIFNPPHSSHHGGVWERQIRTIRRILDSMLLQLGSAQLTHELLVTLMAEVSAIVNARPITALPSDIGNPQPLTPSMLTTMKTRPFTPIPGCFVNQDLYARRRWRRVQYLADQFWLRWKREYIQNLQTRNKWNMRERNMEVGDVVVLKDDSSPRYSWPLARISETHPSSDGHVRKVTVSVMKDGQNREYLRPISELFLVLENQNSGD